MVRKSDLRGAALFLGAVVLMAGLITMVSSVNGAWHWENVGAKTVGIIVGGFLCILGVALVGVALDVIDELSGLLQDIWDSFLGAIRR